MKKDSILITTGIYPPEIGGPATYTALVEGELKKRGWGVAVLPFRLVRFLPSGFRHVAYVFLVLFKSFGKKYIYAQDIFSVGFPSLIAAKILNKKFIVRVPGDFAWEQGAQRFGVKENIDDFQNKKYGRKVEFFRKIQKRVVLGASLVVVPSDYFYNLVSTWGVRKEKLIRIYNGVSVPDGLIDYKNEDKKIISAGRLVFWKGFDTLIEIVSNLPGYKLSIYGDGEDRDRLISMIKNMGVGDRVELCGQVDRIELLSRIKSSTVFVLPSMFESFSFQTVESMAVGTPVVLYDIGNLREIVDSGESGFLVPEGDKDALKKAILSICEDPEKRKYMSENAVERAKNFSLQNTVDSLIKKLP